ncbi:MAG: response regulator [Acidobacteriaceae bacterium]
MNDLILVIDDDATLLGLLTQHLSRAAYHVIAASSGTMGLEMFNNHHPDLVILDIMMPKMNGWAVCERIREESDVPVIMLTAKGEEQDRLRGFHIGVDDYVVKPFSSAELVARVGAILARYHHSSRGTDSSPIVRGDIIIDLAERRVTRGGQHVRLSPTEFRLLAAMARQPGHMISPKELLVQVWGSEYSDDVENVKRYIHYLRQKLEADVEHPRLIMTERGFGYYLA